MTLALALALAACSSSSNAEAPAAATAPTAATTAAPTPAIPAGPVVAVGQPAPDFTLSDTGGATVKLSAHAGRTVVLEWFNPDCPFVEYAYGEGLLPELHQRWGGRDDVVWLTINSGAPGKQGHGVERNTRARTEWSMAVPVLLDETGAVGQRYGAKTTPHMYVIDPQGTLVYAGGLDNAPLGRVEGASRVDHVSAALEEVTAGKPVTTTSSKPYGCSVKYGS